jgi:alpha-galactosidase
MVDSGKDRRIVIIGAGSVSFGLTSMGDLMTTGAETLAGSTIVLHDLLEVNLKRTEWVLKKSMEEITEGGDKAPFKVESTIDPKKALQDADFCIMSIENGNRVETWKQDYYIPRKFGSKQIYGENGGPGGAFHTWRQVPPMLKIAHTMEEICPKAWLLNYSNPVPRVTWAINKASKIKTVGLCHGVISGVNALINILGTRADNLDYISTGLNHFYWFIKAGAKVDFTMPALGSIPEKKATKGMDLLPHIKERGIQWAKMNEKALIEELLKTVGYLTYVEESHPGEYIPWADAYCPYVKYDYVEFARHGRLMKERLERTMKGEEDNYWWVHGSGERAVHVINGIIGNTNQYETAVNVMNNGAISNLPNECCVEVPATVNKDGIHPVKVGNLPKGVLELISHEVNVQRLVVEAAVTGDYDTAIQALMMDGTTPSPQVCREMFAEMLKLQKNLLPQFANAIK